MALGRCGETSLEIIIVDQEKQKGPEISMEAKG